MGKIKGFIICLLVISCTACTPTRMHCCLSTTDDDITTNVQTRIAGDRGIRNKGIQVCTHNRIVTLRGDLANTVQADTAINLAAHVPCVIGVVPKFKFVSVCNC